MTQKLNTHVDKLNTHDIKHVQELAVNAFKRGKPECAHGIVLFTRLEDQSWFFYAWKNTLRDPQAEKPGSLALDQYGNVWIAEGGNDYDGAKQWSLLHKHCVYLVNNPATGVESEHFCPREAAKALAALPASDEPSVLQVRAVGENLDHKSTQNITSVSIQQTPDSEPRYTIVLDLNSSEKKQFTETYLKTALNL